MKVYCSECKRVVKESEGKWKSIGKNQWVFLCHVCK